MFPKEVVLFLEFKKCSLSENSLIQYKTTFKFFFSYCNKPISLITREDVLEWLESYSEGKNDRTIRCRLSNLISLFSFCVNQNIITKIPIKNDWIPSVPDSLPKFLTDSEYAKVMNVVDDLPLRDKTMLSLLNYTGIRCTELRNTTENNINLDTRTLTVIGKGKKQRDVDFNNICRHLLMKLHPVNSGSNEAIFVNEQGEILSSRHIRRIVAKVGRAAGINSSLSPHVFRYTFCNNLMNKDADIYFVAEEMEHADINTTQIYFRLGLKRLKEIYFKYME
jgi:site-specific recombinase XerD